MRIVLIDDSEVVIDVVGGALEDAGFEVTALMEPDKERIAGDSPPAMVLLDINMPEMFGDDVAEFLRSAWGVTAPIYLFSDIPEDELRTRAERVGANGYVWKGKGIEAVVDQVCAILGVGDGGSSDEGAGG